MRGRGWEILETDRQVGRPGQTETDRDRERKRDRECERERK